MRPSIPAGIVLALGIATQSHAASSDLIFCSRQSDRSERLACYEAAARIAERSLAREQNRHPTNRLVSSQPSSQRDNPSAAYASALPIKSSSVPIVAANPFQGAYATLGGSYGVTETVFAPLYPLPSQTPHGASVVGSAGYNHQIGSFVMGIEGSWRYGWERAEASSTTLLFSQFPGIVGGRINEFEFYSDASAHLSARFGFAIDRTLLFARAGIGVSHTRSKLQQTGFGQYCSAIAFVPGTGTVCLQTAPVPSAPNTGTSQWTPSTLVGVGIEQNFGKLFARISGEVEGADGGDFWEARGKAEVGMRF